MFKNLFVGMFVMLVAVSFASAADKVILQNGSEIKAPTIKKNPKAVFLDLGYDVVRVPREYIAKIETGGAASGKDGTKTAAGVTEKSTPASQIYRTAKLKPATIEGNVKRFGEAVVMVNTPGGQGSGFLISPDGYLITNYHVIANETRLKVTVFSKDKTGYTQDHYKNVKIIAMNPRVDLALLKINEAKKKFKYSYMGDMKDVVVGNEVFAIGNPLGLTRSVSQGIVSTRNRNFEGLLYIQTTTDINPGNSGGPLFNMKGEVIGVTSMGYMFFSGLNFAIPTDVVKWFVDNRDAFAYNEDNPNAGFRYLQAPHRVKKTAPPKGKLPTVSKSNK